MILEAQQLLESAEKAELDLSIIHPSLKRPGRTTAIIADLTETGDGVTSISFVDAERALSYWYQANGNQHSFPISKLSSPFFEALSKEDLDNFNKEKDIEKRSQQLSDRLHNRDFSRFPSPFPTGLQSTLRDRLEKLSTLTSTKASRYHDLLTLIGNLPKEHGSKVIQDILEHLKRIALEGSIDLQADAQKILFSLLFTPKKKSVSYTIPIIYNLSATKISEHDSSAPRNFSIINETLLTGDIDTAKKTTDQGLCIITGSSSKLVSNTFPQPTLPVIGKATLFARNKQTPSLSRYGVSGADSLAVSDSHANLLAAALSEMTSKEREGKTWLKIPSDKKAPDLLIAFQAGEEDFPFARAIGDDQIAIGDSQFQELTSRATERIRGKKSDRIRGRILLIVLSAVDPGNRKAILHREISLKNIDDSAKLWSNACLTFPSQCFFLPIEKGKPSRKFSHCVISPGSIPQLTKRLYFEDGRSNDCPNGITFPESLELLLSLAEKYAPPLRLIQICYRRLGPFLARLAILSYRSRSEFYKLKPQDKWLCLKAQSLFAIILTASNRPSHKVMNSLPFQIGQLCAAFDVIHSAYCIVERGGDLPPKLIGNACFQSAGRNPKSALSQVMQRFAPHKAWLTRLQGRLKEATLARFPDKSDTRSTVLYALKLRSFLTDIAPKISAQLTTSNIKVDELFRTELLLGYLAGPNSENHENTNSETLIS